VLRTSPVFGVFSVFAGACWGDGKAPQKPASKAQALITAAEHQLATAQAVDYHAPKSTQRFDARNRAAELYREACELRAGVSPCIWAVSLMVAVRDADPGYEQRIAASTDVLAAMCLDQKDEAACRVFDAVEVKDDDSNFTDATALCERGLADACNAAHLPARACELGDPWGCATRSIELYAEHKKDDALAFLKEQHQAEDARCTVRGFGVTCTAAAVVDAARPDGPEIAARYKRALGIASEGCKRGYLFECETRASCHLSSCEAADLDMLARSCSLTGRRCDELATDRAQLKLPATAVRDALEHGCQFRVSDDCVALVKGYTSKQFPEPVPNRAHSITAYWCTAGTAGYSQAVCENLQKQ
jgi:hypothetical protein